MCKSHRERGSCRCGPQARRGYRFLEPYILLKLKEKPSYGYELTEGLREKIFHGEPDPVQFIELFAFWKKKVLLFLTGKQREKGRLVAITS